MNSEKKEQLREKILLFLNFQYITVKKKSNFNLPEGPSEFSLD